MLKPFVAYDPSFASLLAPNATLELLYESRDGKPVGHEMGIWVWDHNQVWMAAAYPNGSSFVNIMDLSTNTVSPLVPSNGIPVLNPNGGGYHNGKVYITGNGNKTATSCIYAVDPVTLEVECIIDSYFGLRLNGPNDLTWAVRNTSHGVQDWLFFTDDPLNELYLGGPVPQLPDASWRFDPSGQTLLPVIDRTDALVPNGIRANKEGTKLYITNTPPVLVPGAAFTVTSTGQALYQGSESSAIYVYDITDDGFPVNRRLFGLAERGIPDGIHLDDSGRVWTGEADGIVVRAPTGKVLGMFNALAMQGVATVDSGATPLANFALAGDRLVVLAYDKIFGVQLSHQIVSNMT